MYLVCLQVRNACTQVHLLVDILSARRYTQTLARPVQSVRELIKL